MAGSGQPVRSHCLFPRPESARGTASTLSPRPPRHAPGTGRCASLAVVPVRPMVAGVMADLISLRLSATLLLVGQLLYVVVTLFHAGGVANDHPAVFAEYARSGIWTAVHLAQFACMTLFLA